MHVPSVIYSTAMVLKAGPGVSSLAYSGVSSALTNPVPSQERHIN